MTVISVLRGQGWSSRVWNVASWQGFTGILLASVVRVWNGSEFPTSLYLFWVVCVWSTNHPLTAHDETCSCVFITLLSHGNPLKFISSVLPAAFSIFLCSLARIVEMVSWQTISRIYTVCIIIRQMVFLVNNKFGTSICSVLVQPVL